MFSEKANFQTVISAGGQNEPLGIQVAVLTSLIGQECSIPLTTLPHNTLLLITLLSIRNGLWCPWVLHPSLNLFLSTRVEENNDDDDDFDKGRSSSNTI